MIRLIAFFTAILLSAVAGYFLPRLGANREPAPPAAPEPAIQAITSNATSAKVETRRVTRAKTPPAAEIQRQDDEKQLARLEKAYAIMENAEDRSSIIDTISDLETPAIVPALGRLLAIETDPELKEALVSAVGWGEATDDAKAAVFATALAPEQPASVRVEAIDGLSELDPQIALPLLRPLRTDADEEVRTAAQEAVAALENP